MIAINQTRSQEDRVFEDKKHYSQITSYKVQVLTRALYIVINV